MPSYKRLLAAALLILCCHCSYAQNKELYRYQDLSHLYYQKQLDSLKKAWACPAVFKQKETQKQYKELWDDRTDFLTKALKEDNYVYDKELLAYIDGIVDQIARANKQLIPVKPFVLIDRSAAVNAYAVGGNILAINLGLITFAQSKEDIALTIAHELSHNILMHPENAIRQRAEWLTSAEYKKSMNAILDSKYERLTRLKKVFEGYSFNRSRHQRYHESDADSLAILLLKKSSIAFDPSFFLRLDSADIIYKQALKQTLPQYFSAYSLEIMPTWMQKRSKGLSTRAYNFKDTTHIQDSMKTHPDCIERYNRTLRDGSKNVAFTPVPEEMQERARKMEIWSVYYNMNLTACLYMILLEKDKGNKDPWYDFMAANVISGLYYADRELDRFNAISVKPKEYISKDYYELQTLFEQIPRDNLEQFCRTLLNSNRWPDSKKDEAAFRRLMSALTLDPDFSEAHKASVAKAFLNGNENSLYAEFAHRFDKK
ncbi:M48 family metalloprotease [uncultured Chitinophaga sp.]|jgi:Putative Zn-dependent protease, contains TPR repeats|uniref:M48 family metalloprotease n=1 Tax=uncultured Chitinophaga sp. TaxID=339340 RepID=UPI002634E2FA|nr:M48 family metalloprotease [uncultured Chitinophaga sp.]